MFKYIDLFLDDAPAYKNFFLSKVCDASWNLSVTNVSWAPNGTLDGFWPIGDGRGPVIPLPSLVIIPKPSASDLAGVYAPLSVLLTKRWRCLDFHTALWSVYSSLPLWRVLEWSTITFTDKSNRDLMIQALMFIVGHQKLLASQRRQGWWCLILWRKAIIFWNGLNVHAINASIVVEWQLRTRDFLSSVFKDALPQARKMSIIQMKKWKWSRWEKQFREYILCMTLVTESRQNIRNAKEQKAG